VSNLLKNNSNMLLTIYTTPVDILRWSIGFSMFWSTICDLWRATLSFKYPRIARVSFIKSREVLSIDISLTTEYGNFEVGPSGQFSSVAMKSGAFGGGIEVIMSSSTANERIYPSISKSLTSDPNGFSISLPMAAIPRMMYAAATR